MLVLSSRKFVIALMTYSDHTLRTLVCWEKPAKVGPQLLVSPLPCPLNLILKYCCYQTLRCFGDSKPADIEWRYTETGVRVRVSLRTGRIIPLPIGAGELEDFVNPARYEGRDPISCLILLLSISNIHDISKNCVCD